MRTRRRVLITGGNGQVGRAATDAFEAAGWDVTALGRADLDITDGASVHMAVASAEPSVLLNAAAWTDVDGCELDVDRARLINADAVTHIAAAAEAVGASLCHLSTDHVFDGETERPYGEGDPTGPVNAYGRTKLAGECAAGGEALIVRTSWVAGPTGNNFVRKVLDLAADGRRPLRFVEDQFGSFTSARDLAAMIVELVEGGHRGVHHVSNAGEMSRYELARTVLAAAGHRMGRVEPITTAELNPQPAARRPRRSTLANRALADAGLGPLPDGVDAVARLVDELGRN